VFAPRPLAALAVAAALLAAVALLARRSSSAAAPPHAPVPDAMAAAAATSAAGKGGASALIFLHGLGDAGSSWRWMARAFAAPGRRFAFPDAPEQPVTVNGGYVMPSWFDLDDLPVTARTPDDVDGFRASAARIHALIDAEVSAGVDPSRIVLGGFSQGAALSLYAGLRYPRPLGGLILLSGWTAARGELGTCMLPAVAAAKPRVYAAHGRSDDKVDYALGAGTAESLKALGFDVTWRPFDGYHEVARESVDEMGAFVKAVLGS
jgi:predicted esterase